MHFMFAEHCFQVLEFYIRDFHWNTQIIYHVKDSM